MYRLGEVLYGYRSGVVGESRDWSDRFVHEMRIDTAQTRIRREHAITQYDPTDYAVDECRKRLDLAIARENREYFIDVAKYAMLAFIGAKP